MGQAPNGMTFGTKDGKHVWVVKKNIGICFPVHVVMVWNVNLFLTNRPSDCEKILSQDMVQAKSSKGSGAKGIPLTGNISIQARRFTVASQVQCGNVESRCEQLFAWGPSAGDFVLWL